jgi:hypothetical protein
LSKSSTLPFLFIGSGISQRYLKTDSWEGLLKKFAQKDMNYYKSLTGSDFPKMGSQIAEDFFDIWWENEAYDDNRKFIAKNKIELSNKSEPFKYEVAQYLNQSLDMNELSEDLQNEIEMFKQIQISGVITTNYDLLIETIFNNKFKRYIGQEEMLFNKSYEVGEIYKIHGCCSDFKSIVITDEDYIHFEETNLYLTSKLLSFFIEYPIIFMGYAFNDKNIHTILENIVKSVGKKNIDKLHNRLIFIEWEEGISESCIEAIKTINDISLPITHIKTNSYLPIFNVLSKLDKHLPAHLIRQLKDSLYNIVKTDQPTKKILVREADFERMDDLEVVFGIGVVNEVSTKGYNCLESYDLFENLIKIEPIKYSPTKILYHVMQKKLGNWVYLPVYQYLNEANITKDNFTEADLSQKINNIIQFTPQSFVNQGNLEFLSDDKEQIEVFLKYFQENKIAEIDLEAFRLILKKHLKVLTEVGNHAVHQTDFKRLCCLYDKLKYGWISIG